MAAESGPADAGSVGGSHAKRAAIKYPTDSNTLKRAGYMYGDEGVCRGRGCVARISWWITPGGKRIPMSSVIVGTLAEGNREEKLQPHFADCVAAEDFRK